MVHHDAAPYNTILRPFGGLTVIDWDFCAPGDPIEDLAFAAWQWVPLWADQGAVAHGHGGAMTALEAGMKLAALADGYHASIDQRWTLVDACVAQMTKHADDLEAMAGTDPAFARLVDLGVSRNARLDAGWVRDNESRAQLRASWGISGCGRPVRTPGLGARPPWSFPRRPGRPA